MSRELSDQVALADDMAAHFPNNPDLVSLFLEMLAQQRALRLAGKILPAGKLSDYDLRHEDNDWTRP